MANFKVTFFFESTQEAVVGTDAALGWTETWYATSNLDTLETMIRRPEITEYLDKRRAFMDSIYRCAFVRVSDEAYPRRVKIRTMTAFTGALEDQPSKGQVQCAVLCDFMRLPGGPLEGVHHRRFLLRALPASVINGNVINAASPRWPSIILFFNYLGRGASGDDNTQKPAPFWQIRYHDPAQVRQMITRIDVDESNPRRILVQPDVPTWTAGAGIQQGDLIKVTDVQVPGLERTNRTWTLLSRTTVPPLATQMIFGTSRKAMPSPEMATSPVGLGFMQKVAWLYGAADQYAIIGLRSKRTGRVFRQLRGRAPNR